MKRGGGAPLAAAVVALSLMATFAGCSRSRGDKQLPNVKTLGPPPMPTVAGNAAPSTPGDDPAPVATVVEEHVFIAPVDAAPLTYTVTEKRAERAEVDPDLAIVEGARRAASSCFTRISDGSSSRTASIRVTVVPSGMVTRVDVSAPGTEEAWILSCLEGVGNGLRFTDKPKADIRSISIDVSVARAH